RLAGCGLASLPTARSAVLLEKGSALLGDEEGRLWIGQAGALRPVSVRLDGPVAGIAVSPAKTLYVAVTERGRASLLRAGAAPDGETTVVQMAGHTALAAAVFAPDGTKVVTAGDDG